MEVREGYKLSELGVIPANWEVKPVKFAVNLINGRAYKQEELLEQGKYLVLRVGNFFSNSSLYFSNLELPEEQYVDYGDLMYAWSASFGPRFWFGGKTIYHYHIWKVKVNREIDKNFMYYLFEFDKQKILNQSQGGTMFHITKTDMELRKIPLPSLYEQQAISEVLSDTDNLIKALDKQIAKKRSIKQGVMQKLLSPIEGWENKRLGEIGECIIGLTYKPENIRENGTLVLRSSNIQGNTLQYNDNVYVDCQIPEKLINRKNDIIICVRNGSRDLIGKCALMTGRAIGETFGAFMSVFRSQFNEFVFILFQSEIIKRQIDEHLGATINQITNKSLNSFEIPFPPIEEQRRIATILSDIDKEITISEKRMKKLKMIKHSLMQNLLTGKIRLLKS